MQLPKAIKWGQNRLRLLNRYPSSKVKNENNAIRNWISDAFLNQKPNNKPAMNNRRLLIAAVFHFLHPVEKDI